MGCCNRRRDATASDFARPALRPRVAAIGQSGRVMIRYLGRDAVTARGAATGLAYGFSPRDPVKAIDRRDLTPFLRSRLFQLA